MIQREEDYVGRRAVGIWKYQGEGRQEDYVGRRAVGMELQGRRKRGRLRRKEGGGNGSTREKGGGKPKRRWCQDSERITPGRRECCYRFVQNGNVYRHTSTPHRSGIKRKKKKILIILMDTLKSKSCLHFTMIKLLC